MKIRAFIQTLAGAAIVAALGLPGGDANATSVRYQTRYDPPSFVGNATFDVDDACFLGPDGFRTPGGACTPSWLSAEITLNDDSPVDSRTFDYSAFLPSDNLIINIFIAGGELIGVNTGLLGPVELTDSNPDFDGPWWIAFGYSPSDADPEFGTGNGIVDLFSGACFNFGQGRVCEASDTPTDRAIDEGFTRLAHVDEPGRVPEPGTLSLILGALGGAWLVRRRNKGKA